MSIVKKNRAKKNTFDMDSLFESLADIESKKSCVVVSFDPDPDTCDPMISRENFMRMWFEHNSRYDDECDGIIDKGNGSIDKGDGSIDDENEENIETEEEYWEETDHEEWKIYIKPSKDSNDSNDSKQDGYNHIAEKEATDKRWKEDYERQRFWDYDTDTIEINNTENAENTEKTDTAMSEE